MQIWRQPASFDLTAVFRRSAGRVFRVTFCYCPRLTERRERKRTELDQGVLALVVLRSEVGVSKVEFVQDNRRRSGRSLLRNEDVTETSDGERPECARKRLPGAQL